MKKLLILCGGQSPEHPISIRSTKNILKALSSSRYQVTIIGISRSGAWRLLAVEDLGEEVTVQGREVVIVPGKGECFWVDGKSLGSFDAVFPVLHGPHGEDGTIQGLLQLLGLPFVGSRLLSSAVAMDKDITKRLLTLADVKVAKWLLVEKEDTVPVYEKVVAELGQVLFVKPANMGSSFGVNRVSQASEWEGAVQEAFKYDDKVLVEEGIEGRELECAVLGNNFPEASDVGEVCSGVFYSFDEKYAEQSNAEIVIPALVPEDQLQQLKDTAIRTYKALRCQGLSRVDMFLTSQGEVYVNEVNTLPGFTSISMYPKLWEQAGLSYDKLLDRLIELACEAKSESTYL